MGVLATYEELRDLVLEMEIVTKEDLEDCHQESQSDSTRSTWIILRERGLLDKSSVDFLEMASKGYLPLSATRASLQVNARRRDESKSGSSISIIRRTSESSVRPAIVKGSHPGIIRRADPPATPAIIKGTASPPPAASAGRPADTTRPSMRAATPSATTQHSESAANRPRQPARRRATGVHNLVGRHLGKYQINSQLGKGASGWVFMGTNTMLNMTVAIKVLDPQLAAFHPELLRRFQHEARTAARITHRNVVRVLDCDQIDDFNFIVMEYVDGISVSDMLRMQGRILEDKALEIILSVAEGLEAAQALGIIHRDIKPANIMRMKTTNEVKVADLGLAKDMNAEGEMSDTRPNVGLGTPHYFAPEQANNASGVDHRADICALGCTLYHMLSGRVPFEGKSVGELIRQHEQDEAKPLHEVVPGISRATSEMTRRMMAKSPDDRHQDYGELMSALQTCIVGLRTAPDPTDPSATSGVRSGRQSGVFKSLVTGILGGEKREKR